MLNPIVTEWLTKPGGLAPRLRSLREASGLAGKEVAAATGWHPSKVSRLETGKQVPSEADLRAWASAVGASPAVLAALVDLLGDVQATHDSWRRQLAGGIEGTLREVVALVEGSTVARYFDTAVVPGLVQTADYAEAVLREVVDVHQLGGDERMERLVGLRLAPQRYLYEPPRRFDLLMSEQVLTRRPAALSAEGMRDQLARLRESSTLPRVRLGVIPADVPFRTAPMHTFVIYDDQARIETLVGESTHTGEEAADLGKVLDRLWDEASEGDEARRLITAAAEEQR